MRLKWGGGNRGFVMEVMEMEVGDCWVEEGIGKGWCFFRGNLPVS